MLHGDGVTVVEWADKLLPLLPARTITVTHHRPRRRAAADRDHRLRAPASPGRVGRASQLGAGLRVSCRSPRGAVAHVRRAHGGRGRIYVVLRRRSQRALVAAAVAHARRLYRSVHVDRSSPRGTWRTWVARADPGVAGGGSAARAALSQGRGGARRRRAAGDPARHRGARAERHGRGARDAGAARLAVRGSPASGWRSWRTPRGRARQGGAARRGLRDHAPAPLAQRRRAAWCSRAPSRSSRATGR